MYTATITSSFKQDGKAYVDVTLSNGTDTVKKQFVVTSDADLKNRVRAEISTLNELEATTFSNGALDASAPVEVLTQAEIDKRAWFAQYYRWLSVKRNLIDTGLFTEAQPQIATLKATVISGFKVAYLNDI